MKNAGRYMDALTLHYYTLCGDDWAHKGAATGFTADEYYKTLVRAGRMEELVTRHLEIMDQYDPQHRVGLIVDEWGAWYDVEPGTNPGFLYQQNTMRDAMVAAITLDVFNKHCDRVIMANLAQTVNVLQSVVLTEGDKMVLTPTYHVFDLYKAHQDAEEVDCFVQADEMTYPMPNGKGGVAPTQLALLTASASQKDGVITLTAANIDADEGKDVLVSIADMKAAKVSARILAGEMGQYNDFDNSPLAIADFDGVEITDEGIVLHLPKCCVVEVSIEA